MFDADLRPDVISPEAWAKYEMRFYGVVFTSPIATADSVSSGTFSYLCVGWCGRSEVLVHIAESVVGSPHGGIRMSVQCEIARDWWSDRRKKRAYAALCDFSRSVRLPVTTDTVDEKVRACRLF